MKISKLGLDLIKFFEGFSAVPYLCQGGYWTIGYGHKLLRGETLREVTKDQALDILKADVNETEIALQRLIFVDLKQHQYDALVSFVYNIGTGAFQRSTLRQKLHREEFEAAAEEFLRWTFASGKLSKGLAKRREAERKLFLGV